MCRHFSIRRACFRALRQPITITVAAFCTSLFLADAAAAPAADTHNVERSQTARSQVQSANRSGMYKRIDRGISIDSPSERDVLFPGGPLDIVYRITGDQSPTMVRFMLFGPGSPRLLGATEYLGADASPQTASFPVPADARTGRYLIYANADVNANHGLSDEFRVERIDLSLEEIRFDWPDRSGNWPLRARVRNLGDYFEGQVRIDLILALFGVDDVRSFTRELRLRTGESTNLVLTRLDNQSLRRYRHQCGLPLTAELQLREASVPDMEPSNNGLDSDLYLPYGGLRIHPSIVVVRQEGTGGARVEEGGSLAWIEDLGVDRPDSGRTTSLVTAIHVKNCDARPLSEGAGGSPVTGETISYRASVSGSWPCGGGRLGDCRRDELVLWGPVPYRMTNGPGVQSSIPITLPALHQVPLQVDLEVTSVTGGHSWVTPYDGDSFRFSIVVSR